MPRIFLAAIAGIVAGIALRFLHSEVGAREERQELDNQDLGEKALARRHLRAQIDNLYDELNSARRMHHEEERERLLNEIERLMKLMNA